MVDLAHEPVNIKDLLSLFAASTEIVLTELGAPVARLVPMSPCIARLQSGSITTQ
jgi:antitoxin (DNA-binding transcriptional repressor) of toxin-antitoxin stability system